MDAGEEGVEEECSIDSQAFLRIQANLLALPALDALNETPRASVATTRLKVSHPSSYFPRQHFHSTSHSFELEPSPQEEASGHVFASTAPHRNRRNLAELKIRSRLEDVVADSNAKSKATKASYVRKTRVKMDEAPANGRATASNEPNDTQIMPSQVYYDYFNSEKRRASPTRLNTQPSTFASSLDLPSQAYKTGDAGHVDLAFDNETNERDLQERSDGGSDKALSQSEQSQDDDNDSVTSPLAPSPTTPAVLGQKHDRQGNIITHQQLPSANHATPQDIGAMFKEPQTKSGMRLSQVFKQTQAATSPVLDEVQSDPVLERPSPDFHAIQRFSSPALTSPNLVKGAAPEKTFHDPKDLYVSMKQSQERRRIGVFAQQQASTLDEDDEFDGFGLTSMYTKKKRRRKRGADEDNAKKQSAAFRTSPTPHTNSHETPAAQIKGHEIVEISDDTPLNPIIEEDEDVESDVASADQFNELSQAITRTNKTLSVTADGELSDPDISSPLPQREGNSSNDQATPQSFHNVITTHISSANGHHEQRTHSNQFLSQSVKVANSQPDKSERLTSHVNDRSESSDQLYFVPQSQMVGSGRVVGTNVSWVSGIPASSSVSAKVRDYLTSETNLQGTDVSESPESSPPLNVVLSNSIHSSNDSDSVRRGNTTNRRKNLLPEGRRSRLRTVPDRSPRSSTKAQYSLFEVPSASLPESDTKDKTIKNRSLARSHSTSAYDTAHTNHPPAAKDRRKKLSRERPSQSLSRSGQNGVSPVNPKVSQNQAPAVGTTSKNEYRDVPEHPPATAQSSQENNPPATADQTISPNGKVSRQSRYRSAPQLSRTTFPLPVSQEMKWASQNTPPSAPRYEPETTHEEVTVEDSRSTSHEIFADRVFARFKDTKMLYWPGTCLGLRSGNSVPILYDDGIIDQDVPSTVVKTLQLHPGDVVKVDRPALRKNEYLVKKLCDRVIPTSRAVSTDVFGHQSVILELKQLTNTSTAVQNDSAVATIQIPLAEIYLTNQLFARFADRPAPVVISANANEGVQTPLEGQSRPSTPSSRNRRQTSHASKKPSLQTFYSLPDVRAGLFSNMIFAITHVPDKDFDEKKTASEKNLATKLINENGGRLIAGGFEELFEALNAQNTGVEGKERDQGLQVKSAFANAGFAALITNSFSRSTKFIQALALNIPCLSTRWVIDSVESKVLLPWSRYLLPAGKSRVLGDAVRSRTFQENGMPASEAGVNKFADIIQARPRFLHGLNIIMVTGRTKAEQERRQTYVFLCYALGAENVELVKDVEAAKALVEGSPTAWDLLGVDEDATVRTESEMKKPRFINNFNGKSRKRRNANNTETANQPEHESEIPVRVVGTEFLVQSLIMGTLVE